MELRTIGTTDLRVTPVAMGCWPITGITSINVTEADSLATIQAALDSGINFFDTAWVYGFDGESERMLGRVLGERRGDIVIATKGGLHWENKRQQRDASRATILRQCEESLRRLRTDYIDLYYLHAPDPQTPLEETAAALQELRTSGKARAIGASNLSLQQLEQLHAVCPLDAIQPHYNMLQREIEEEQFPWCQERNVSVIVYWPLMKGLLAGRLPRDHQFEARDGRKKYPMFQGDEWERNQDFIDRLRGIAADSRRSVAEVVIAWTVGRRGITAALCGAKRADQIRENAAAMTLTLTDDQLNEIDNAIRERGPIVSRAAV